jgi:hypothetical protein
MKEIFKQNGLNNGRMISATKSSYIKNNPGHEVYFNANVFILGEGKIWYGDLDLDKDTEKLKFVAAELGKSLYVLKEKDGRFGREKLSDPEILELAVRKVEI